MKNDWTVCIILIILIGSFAFTGSAQQEKAAEKEQKAGKTVDKQSTASSSEMKIAELEARLKAVKLELSVIRKELTDVLNEADKKDIETARLKASIAGSLAQGSIKSYDKEAVELLDALRDVSDKGDKLVTASAEFCDFIDALLDKKEITDVEKVRARFRMEKLKTAAEIFHARIKTPPKGKLFTSCRVLAVDDKLQVAVVSVGSVYGMRNGLLLKTGTKKEGQDNEKAEKTVKLKVIAVRPFISGAVIIEGSTDKLAPGTVLYPGS